jgi:microsomal dipeptidase-like Zn-dependent dipeptidase
VVLGVEGADAIGRDVDRIDAGRPRPHIADTVGAEHLAVGTDMNGVPGVMAGFGDETDLPKLTGALLDGGFDDREVAGVLGGNALRVLGRVEAEARRAPS